MTTPAAQVAVEIIFTAPTGNRTAGRIHRATCKHIAKTAERLTPAQAGVDALLAASRATCCSVREFDRRNAVTAARSTELDEADGATIAAVAPDGEVTVIAETRHVDITAPETDTVAEPAATEAAEAEAPSDKQAARTAARAAKIGTFTADGVTVHTCVGECGSELPVKKFPTVTGTPGLRVAECRTCRDTRSKAAKTS